MGHVTKTEVRPPTRSALTSQHVSQGQNQWRWDLLAARYFTLSNGRWAENAVWSYEHPYDELSVIKERLAFYPEKVDSITTVQE